MLSRVQNIGVKLTARATNLLSSTVYYGKVGAELSKQVYKTEKLQPPTLNEFKTVYTKIFNKSLYYVERPKDVINCASKITKDDVLKYGIFGIQLLGFYSVGEVIGRRKLVGYRSYSSV